VHELLTHEGAPRLAVLSGMGGVGKTSVAAEYAHRHLTEVGVAWQVRCEDPAVLAQDMAELAAQVGGRELADPRDPVASAHAVLAAFPSEWLLIFDNAADEPCLARFVPPAGPGRVVVTSQSQHWPGRHVLDVPVLDPEVAAQFLANRAADQNMAAARELAAELGNLPLALEQAAAYARATAGTLDGYLVSFRQRRADLLARGQAAGHPLDVAATLGVALARLEADAPAAAGLLRLLACLAPEPVPVGLLLSDAGLSAELDPEVAAVLMPLLGDPIATGDAVAALRRYSLVTPAGAGMVLVHRLVQAVTLGQASGTGADPWRRAARVLTEASIPADVRLPATWPVCAVLLPHAQAVLPLTGTGICQIAHYLGHGGSHAAARDLWRQIAEAREQDCAYGAEHPDTLTARADLAHWTGRAGDPARARDLFAELIPRREQVLGPEHPDTLRALHDLAEWTGKAGDPAMARDMFAELLPVREHVLGAEHPLTLDTQSRLASWTGQAGDPARARDRFADLMLVCERVLGAEHPEAQDAQHDLAYWTGHAGDPARARELTAELIPVREQTLGPEHPKTLETLHDLAYWTGHAGDSARARDMTCDVLPLFERVLGTGHPDTLDVRHWLARWTGEAGDPAAARDQLAELLPACERVLHAEHPDTRATRDSLDYWTQQADSAG